MQEWGHAFPEWDRANLRTHRVRPMGVDRCLVHESHPVVCLLRCNVEAFLIDVDTLQRDADGYVVLPRDVVEVCVWTIRKKVLLSSKLAVIFSAFTEHGAFFDGDGEIQITKPPEPPIKRAWRAFTEGFRGAYAPHKGREEVV